MPKRYMGPLTAQGFSYKDNLTGGNEKRAKEAEKLFVLPEELTEETMVM